MSSEPLFRNCPACGAGMMPKAKVCVKCGSSIDSLDQNAVPPSPAPIDDAGNPYRSPQAGIVVAKPLPSGQFYSDLTPEAARRAESFVTEAESVLPIIVALWCFCGPLWLVMTPYYGWRLIAWKKLNEQYSELQYANSDSPYGSMAVKFQSAWKNLLIGFVAGAVFWTMSFVLLVVNMIAIVLDNL